MERQKFKGSLSQRLNHVTYIGARRYQNLLSQLLLSKTSLWNTPLLQNEVSSLLTSLLSYSAQYIATGTSIERAECMWHNFWLQYCMYVSSRANAPRWSIMVCDVRISTQTEVSLQKCNYIYLMVFPVVRIDNTDAGRQWQEIGKICTWAACKEASDSTGSKGYNTFSFHVYFSEVSIHFNPKLHSNAFHRDQVSEFSISQTMTFTLTQISTLPPVLVFLSLAVLSYT